VTPTSRPAMSHRIELFVLGLGLGRPLLLSKGLKKVFPKRTFLHARKKNKDLERSKFVPGTGKLLTPCWEASDTIDKNHNTFVADNDWTLNAMYFSQTLRSKYERRGEVGMKGHWVSLEEAKEFANDTEWWAVMLDGRSVPIPLNTDKPIWKYQNGQMFLGSWKDTATCPVEHGFGVCHCGDPEKIKGLVYIGGRKNGTYHGRGKTFWLRSSKTWRADFFAGSPIRQKIGTRTVGLPFEYVGEYINGQHEDPKAIVTLKDGTARRGPWKDGKPIGNWWKDHKRVAAVTPPPPRCLRQSSERKPPSRYRQSREDTTGSGSVARVPPTLLEGSAAAAAAAAETSRPPRRKRRQSNEEESRTPADVARIATEQRSAAEASRPPPSRKRRQINHEIANATEGGREESSAANPIPDTPPSSNGPQQLEDERDRKTVELTDWLVADVIGRSPIVEEMRVYAQELMKTGFHSSEVVAEFCTEDDISSWAWMLPIHKRIFRAWLQNHGNST
jgi:hypothetical protein